jgi:hypothetical protein
VFQVVLASVRTPEAVVERLSHEIAAVLREPAIRERLAELAAERVVGSTLAEAAEVMARETPRWSRIQAEASVRQQRQPATSLGGCTGAGTAERGGRGRRGVARPHRLA